MCNRQWHCAWRSGACYAGDETIVPHKGKRCGRLRQFVPRKPHSTGLKLYVLADSCRSYVIDMFLYCSKPGVVRRANPRVTGQLTPSEVVGRWTTKIPPGVALCADSYFGSHATAKACASQDTPFLFLTKRDEFGVQTMGQGIRPGHVSTATHRHGHYSMAVYKNPKVGSKPPRVVPLLTNCTFQNRWWWSGRAEIPCEIGAYRQLAGGVDTANQLALQHREVGRFRSWSKALRAFVVRYAISNSFVACKSIDLIPENTSLWDFQLGFMHSVMPPMYVPPQEVHCPVKSPTRGTCKVCGKRTCWVCKGCGVHVHMKNCFLAHHGLV